MSAVFLVLGVNYIADPYRIFHRPWIKDNGYINDHSMRVEASGIINSEKFDAIILGNSHSENFSALEASNTFGSKYVNLSMSGSSINERALVLNYVLRKKRINQVIFQLDSIPAKITSLSKSPIYPYKFLYDEYAINDLLIYIKDIKSSFYSLCTILQTPKWRICKIETKPIESMLEWDSNPEYASRFGGLTNWLNGKDKRQNQNYLKTISTSINKIKTNDVVTITIKDDSIEKIKYHQFISNELLPLIKQQPHTEFYFFFPPLSRLKFAIDKKAIPENFEQYKEIIKLFVITLGPYPNVKIFGFEQENFLDEIANYKDLTHFHPDFNHKMLEWMHSGKNQLNQGNLDEYLLLITNKSDSYSFEEFESFYFSLNTNI